MKLRIDPSRAWVLRPHAHTAGGGMASALETGGIAAERVNGGTAELRIRPVRSAEERSRAIGRVAETPVLPRAAPSNRQQGSGAAITA